VSRSPGLSRDQVAWRVAQDIEDGAYVNLGIGQPELVANHVAADREVVFHSENGILGMGKEPAPGEEDEELINAGKKPVTLVPGGSFFHHADSFAMVRGGHIDICVLGAFQVSAAGDLANWSTGQPGAIPAVGGAMDLAAGAKRVFVMMNHCTKDGEAKIVARCAYPLTGQRVVTTIYTDLAVVDVAPDGLVAREIVDGLDFAELADRTAAPIRLANDWRRIAAPTP
jgi:3-oxoadipate CoA-transferase beta subunit